MTYTIFESNESSGVTYDLLYDELENIISDDENTYIYELDKLVAIQNNSKNITYEYDCNGFRTYKKVLNTDGTYQETYYNVSENKIIKETRYDSSTNTTTYIIYIYDESGVAGFKTGTSLDNLTTYYYLKNLQNDVIQIIDINSNVVVEYTYDAYGNVFVSGTLSNTIGGGISSPISNISSRNRSSSARSMSRASASSTPFANVVAMTNYSTTLVDNILFGMALGNISHTTTIQHNNSGVFYRYSNIGNSTSSIGVGLNIKDWYGLNAYVSSNIGIGSSMQLGSITYGAEISVLDGVSFSFGTVTGNVTNETSVSIGWGTLAFAYAACGAIDAAPVPMARAVAAVAVCVVVLIDTFN